MQDNTPTMKKKQANGYWEVYFNNGKLWFNQNYINGELCGLYQWYNRNGDLKDKSYYAR